MILAFEASPWYAEFLWIPPVVGVTAYFRLSQWIDNRLFRFIPVKVVRVVTGELFHCLIAFVIFALLNWWCGNAIALDYALHDAFRSGSIFFWLLLPIRIGSHYWSKDEAMDLRGTKG